MPGSAVAEATTLETVLTLVVGGRSVSALEAPTISLVAVRFFVPFSPRDTFFVFVTPVDRFVFPAARFLAAIFPPSLDRFLSRPKET